MPVEVYRDERETAREAVMQHAGFDLPADLRVARYSENVDHCIVHPGAKYHSACLVLSGAMIRTDKRAPKIVPGTVSVEPTDFGGTFTNDEQTDWLSVYIDEDRMKEIGEALSSGGATPHLERVAGQADPGLANLIRSCAQSLLRNTPVTRLELDGWAQVIGVHLLRNHSDMDLLPEVPRGALDEPLLRQVLEAIEERVDGDLSLASLAQMIGLGTTRLSAGFRAAMGKSLHQYVIERRVERARDMIENTSLPLVDIAFSAGFSSQSHMTAAFRGLLGITPGKYRSTLRH